MAVSAQADLNRNCRRCFRLLPVLVLVLAFFLLLLLLLLLALAFAVAVIAEVAFVAVGVGVFEDFHGLALLRFKRLALGLLEFALFAVIFPGVEDQMQPRHHLFDRRQLAGRPGLAARALFARRTGLSLRPGLAAFALRTGVSRRPTLG